MKKGISVIVCCYNSATRLPETLKHLLQQKTIGIDWEIIVVDNASTDNTYELSLQMLSAKLDPKNFKVVKEQEPGLINARKKGFSVCSYEYLLFCDDDNWMEQNYLQLGFSFMESNPNIAILGGWGTAAFENIKPAWFDKYEENFAVGLQTDKKEGLAKVDAVYGAGFIARRRLFDELDALGFKSLLSGRKGDKVTSGEDTELCLMARFLGYDIYATQQLKFKHLMTDGRMNWNYMKKLHRGFGRARVYLNAYRYMQTAENPPGANLRYPLWFDKLINLLKEINVFSLKVILGGGGEENDEELKFEAYKGEISELWKLKDNYAAIFETIRSLKQRIAVMKK